MQSGCFKETCITTFNWKYEYITQVQEKHVEGVAETND